MLRYPGGKSRGALHKRIIACFPDKMKTFGEPFFGSGAISFALLRKSAITRLVTAEKDASLRTLWYTVRDSPNTLCRQVRCVEPSVKLFLTAKKRVLEDKASALDALVVNRLAHGGRGVMAGPQGGLKQDGKYKIGCRWNPEKLQREICECSDLLNSVKFSMRDSYWHLEADYYYVDPPYWEVGKGLYMHSFSEEDHGYLYTWLRRRRNWVLSYNNHPEIRRLYTGYRREVASVAGNGGEKKNSEILIFDY